MADIEPICTVNRDVNFNGVVFSNKFEETYRNPPYQQNSGLSHPPADSQDRKLKGHLELEGQDSKTFCHLESSERRGTGIWR
jgi:hypothetical protein